MEKQLRHYIEYAHFGIVVNEVSVREISERDVSKVSIPDNCIGFRFFDRTVVTVDRENLTGKRKNISGWYYRGEKMTLEQIKAAYGNDRNYKNLILNMEINHIRAVVRTKFDQFIPLDYDDQVI